MSCLATEPPQDTKPAGSPEAPQQEPGPSPEPPSSQSFTQSIKAELPHHPESPSSSGAPETSLQGEELSSSLEEKKTITPATKDLTSISEPSNEEPMDVSFSTVEEASIEDKANSVPKVEEVKNTGLFEEKKSESVTPIEQEKVPEEAERSTEPLTLEERESVTEDPAVPQHHTPSEVSLKENDLDAMLVDEQAKSCVGLLVEQQERSAEECNKSSDSFSVEKHEGASDGVKTEVPSEGHVVAPCESHAVKEHEKGLTVRKSEFPVEERKKSSEDLGQVMEFSMDGERSLAKLSSLVEERTSLKPSVVRQPESFHCSVINTQNLSALGEPTSNVPSATFIPLTPKIGMGKPAISKRKFSPGRPRVKQVGPTGSEQIIMF